MFALFSFSSASTRSEAYLRAAQHGAARRSAHACAHDAALHGGIGSDRIGIVRVVGASSQQATTTCNMHRGSDGIG